MRRSALPRVPSYARVGLAAVGEDRWVWPSTAADWADLRGLAVRVAAEQVELGELVRTRLESFGEPRVTQLGAVAYVHVASAFCVAFGARLTPVRLAEWTASEHLFVADEEYRQSNSCEILETEDLVLQDQPVVTTRLREFVASALADPSLEMDVEQAWEVYRLLLVTTVALSHAVAPPQGTPREFGPSA